MKHFLTLSLLCLPMLALADGVVGLQDPTAKDDPAAIVAPAATVKETVTLKAGDTFPLPQPDPTFTVGKAPTPPVAQRYFRLINPAHPQPVAGALIDPQEPGRSELASLLPLVTHSTADGCLLPSVVCEDWTPLAVGASINAGKVTLDVAPLANVLPWMSALLGTLPGDWDSIRDILAPKDAPPVTFSAGPVWQYRQATDKGYFRVFTGLALHF